jgi:transmembrane sensor
MKSDLNDQGPATAPGAVPGPEIMNRAAEWKARVDAGLTPREDGELRAWLAADPRHEAALARFDLVWDRFDRPFHAGATGELLHELDVRAKYRRRRVASAVASIAVLCVLGMAWRWGGVTGLIHRGENRLKSAGATVLRLQEQRTLADGSVVELKEDAEIVTDFTPALRRVTLTRGEALFQVTKDPKRPFIVTAGEVEVRAVGTMFAVEKKPAGVEVLVTEGRVAVNQAPAAPLLEAAPDQGMAIAPELLATLDAGNGVMVDVSRPDVPPQVTAILPAEITERLAWRAPRVEFTRTRLSDAIAVLNGYSAGRRSAGQRSIQFVIDDSAIGSVRLSGLFRVDNIDAFVGLLKTFGIEAEFRGDSEILLRKSRTSAKSNRDPI